MDISKSLSELSKLLIDWSYHSIGIVLMFYMLLTFLRHTRASCLWNGNKKILLSWWPCGDLRAVFIQKHEGKLIYCFLAKCKNYPHEMLSGCRSLSSKTLAYYCKSINFSNGSTKFKLLHEPSNINVQVFFYSYVIYVNWSLCLHAMLSYVYTKIKESA